MKLKLKMPKVKTKLTFSWIYIYILIIIMISAIIIILGWFLYKHFYQTVTQSKQIDFLRHEVAPDTINLEKVNKVLQLLNEKTNLEKTINWPEIKNPFNTTAVKQPPVP
jgi:flagellar basal body-associated protein FliL